MPYPLLIRLFENFSYKIQMLVTWTILLAVLHLECFPPSLPLFCVNISVEIVKTFLKKSLEKLPSLPFTQVKKKNQNKQITDILFSSYFLALE